MLFRIWNKFYSIDINESEIAISEFSIWDSRYKEWLISINFSLLEEYKEILGQEDVGDASSIARTVSVVTASQFMKVLNVRVVKDVERTIEGNNEESKTSLGFELEYRAFNFNPKLQLEIGNKFSLLSNCTIEY